MDVNDWIGNAPDTTQGSMAWMKARKRRLGGSEIASVLRLSPYKTRRELWEEKTGRRESPSIGHLPHVRRGIEAEPIARALLEERRGVKYTTPMLVHPQYPWAVASLDGLCDYHTLEIKTMAAGKHNDVKMRGEIPDYYAIQLHWGLWIAEALRLPARSGLFASYRPEDGTMHEAWVQRDDNLWMAMERAAIEFWGWVETDTVPPEDFVYGP
jgi:putative phage-type endonuclease